MKRDLAYYRKRFPNIDWSHPSPAAEFAMKPEDVDAVFAEMPKEEPANSSFARAAMRGDFDR